VRRIVAFLLSFCLVLLPVCGAAEDGNEDSGSDDGFVWDEERDLYLPTTTYEPGRGKTVLIASGLGVFSGLVVGGLLLVFYQNPDADKNFDTMMIITGMAGFGGGLALGLTLPADVTKEDAAASLDLNQTPGLTWRLPAVGFFEGETLSGKKEQVWRTNLFQLRF